MQKAFLRRDGDGAAAVGQQDRLAQLQVPGAQRQLLALESGDLEIGAAHACRAPPSGRPVLRAVDGVADHAHRRPRPDCRARSCRD